MGRLIRLPILSLFLTTFEIAMSEFFDRQDHYYLCHSDGSACEDNNCSATPDPDLIQLLGSTEEGSRCKACGRKIDSCELCTKCCVGNSYFGQPDPPGGWMARDCR